MAGRFISLLGSQHFDPADPVHWDRSFGLKARLWQEGSVLPSIAVGITDLEGNGIYSSEYLVASKQFGDFDATLGIGWGRLGSANNFRNPVAQLSRSLETRPTFPTAARRSMFTCMAPPLACSAALHGAVPCQACR